MGIGEVGDKTERERGAYQLETKSPNRNSRVHLFEAEERERGEVVEAVAVAP